MKVGRAGLEVLDWVGLEAIMCVKLSASRPRFGAPAEPPSLTRRYVFHVGLPLPRPPLAHPCLLSLPPHLPPVLVDQFHALLFERLLVPQLLVGTRPFFAAAAAGVLSAVILDIGNRNEGSEISVVHENQVVEGATMRLPLDEGVLDDWAALKLLEEDPELPRKISPTQELGPGQLATALRTMVASLKAGDVIGFASPAFEGHRDEAAAGDDGELDIAKALVEGKVDKIVGRKKGKKGAEGETEEDGDFVTVPHPFNTAAEALRIGPARHRYLEPLFLPHLVAGLAPSASPAAALLGLQEYEGREVIHAGVQEMIGAVVQQVDDPEERRAIWEAVVIMSAGKVANNKGESRWRCSTDASLTTPTLGAALGPTLIPLLTPFTIDPESGSETQPKVLRYARTPEYFSEYKERGGELGCFLGGCIMAKLLIGDLQSRLFMVRGASFLLARRQLRLTSPCSPRSTTPRTGQRFTGCWTSMCSLWFSRLYCKLFKRTSASSSSAQRSSAGESGAQ